MNWCGQNTSTFGPSTNRWWFNRHFERVSSVLQPCTSVRVFVVLVHGICQWWDKKINHGYSILANFNNYRSYGIRILSVPIHPERGVTHGQLECWGSPRVTNAQEHYLKLLCMVFIDSKAVSNEAIAKIELINGIRSQQIKKGKKW